MPIVDTGSLLGFHYGTQSQVMLVFVQVLRDDGLADNLSPAVPARREITLSLAEITAENATHAGQTLTGVQWLVGARKAVLQAIKTKLASDTDAVSVGIKSIPTA